MIDFDDEDYKAPRYPYSRKVGRIVRRIRRTRRISQQQLGEVLGVGQHTVCRKEAGRYPFVVDELEKIAAHFGISVFELLPKDTTEKEGT